MLSSSSISIGFIIAPLSGPTWPHLVLDHLVTVITPHPFVLEVVCFEFASQGKEGSCVFQRVVCGCLWEHEVLFPRDKHPR